MKDFSFPGVRVKPAVLFRYKQKHVEFGFYPRLYCCKLLIFFLEVSMSRLCMCCTNCTHFPKDKSIRKFVTGRTESIVEAAVRNNTDASVSEPKATLFLQSGVQMYRTNVPVLVNVAAECNQSGPQPELDI